MAFLLCILYNKGNDHTAAQTAAGPIGAAGGQADTPTG
jgi:hypothetical protein